MGAISGQDSTSFRHVAIREHEADTEEVLLAEKAIFGIHQSNGPESEGPQHPNTEHCCPAGLR